MATLLVEGVRLHYQWSPGDPARTVAFLNGVMASASSWELYADLWASAGWGVLLHDFRGQLQSDKPPGPYTFHRHVQDLAALLDHLGVRKAHLIGTSYGGEVALHAAVEQPERVSSLAIIDSASEIDPLLEAFVRSWSLLSRPETARELYWAAIPSLYSSGFIAANRTFLEERAQVFAALPAEYFAGQRALYETFLGLNITARLPEIPCPALVVCGEEDILKPPRFSRLIAEGIAASELVLLPRCGHVAIFEQPETLKRLLFGFTSRHGG